MASTQVKRRRGTTIEHNDFIGAEGEITVDTTTWQIILHDGASRGGHRHALENHVHSNYLLNDPANVFLKSADIGTLIASSTHGHTVANLSDASTIGKELIKKTTADDMLTYIDAVKKPLTLTAGKTYGLTSTGWAEVVAAVPDVAAAGSYVRQTGSWVKVDSTFITASIAPSITPSVIGALAVTDLSTTSAKNGSSTTVARNDHKHLLAEITDLTTTAFGLGFVNLADAAAARTKIAALADAPSDTSSYVRKAGAWVTFTSEVSGAISSLGGAVPEAPTDTKPYIRKSSSVGSGSNWFEATPTVIGAMATTHAANEITGLGTSGTAKTVARTDHTHTIANVTDATTIGQAVVKAATQSAALTAIGAVGLPGSAGNYIATSGGWVTLSTALGTDLTAALTTAGGLTDAPNDGKNYLRTSQAWSDIHASTNAWTANQTFNMDATFKGSIIEEPTTGSISSTGTTALSATKSLFVYTISGTSPAVTFTFPAGVAGKQFTLILNNGTGAYSVVWPTTIQWAGAKVPALSTTSGQVDVLSFVYSGTNWIGFTSGLKMGVVA